MAANTEFRHLPTPWFMANLLSQELVIGEANRCGKLRRPGGDPWEARRQRERHIRIRPARLKRCRLRQLEAEINS